MNTISSPGVIAPCIARSAPIHITTTVPAASAISTLRFIRASRRAPLTPCFKLRRLTE